MRNKTYIHPATIFILLSLAVVLCSWVGSGFGWQGVQNLLSVDGVRWILRHAETNFMSASAWAVVCVLFFGCGLVVHSGLGDALRRMFSHERKLSKKQKRALALSGLVACLYIGCILLLVWGPWGIVRSVTGMFQGSPLQDGMLMIISFGIGLSGMAYGFAVDNYRRDIDVYRGMSCLFAEFAEYIVTLFFIIQFFAALSYSRLLPFWGISDEFVYLFYAISCIIPFFLHKKRALLH